MERHRHLPPSDPSGSGSQGRRSLHRTFSAKAERGARASMKLRFIGILTGVAVWCIAAATVAYAKGVPDPHPVFSVVAPSSGGPHLSGTSGGTLPLFPKTDRSSRGRWQTTEAAAGRKLRAIIQTASTISCTARGMNNKVCSVEAEGPPRRRVPAVRVVVRDKTHGHGRRTDQESVRLQRSGEPRSKSTPTAADTSGRSIILT